MDTFMLDLHVASLPMRLIAIGFNRDSFNKADLNLQHRHNLFELQYVHEGQCITRIGDELCTQRRDEVYLIAPGVYHSQKSSSTPFEKMCVIFELPTPPRAGDKPAEEVFFALGTAQKFLCREQRMTDSLKHLRSAFLEYENRICGLDEIRIRTELIILQLVQCISSPEKRTFQTGTAKIQRVYLIDEFFNKNFHRKNGDMLLAKKLDVSVRQLNRILQNQYGYNFREKLKEIRLEVALDLLSGGKSIAEISEIIGYSCPANFSTFIKNATGKTPSKLRRLLGARAESKAGAK